MADYDLVQVSELTATETPANADVLPIQQGTTLKKITYQNLKSNVVSDEANARQNADNLKLNKPTGGNGTSGQMLLTNGDGSTQWASPDATLATTGKAADAKATGDAIKAVDANLAAPYSTSATYVVGDYCTKDGVLKRCKTAITTAEAWNSAHWDDAKLGGDVSTLRSALNLVDTEVFGDIDSTFPLTFENGTYSSTTVGQPLEKYYGGGYDKTRKVVKSTVFNAPCNVQITAKTGYSFTVFTSNNGVITSNSGLVTEYSMAEGMQYGIILRATGGSDDISAIDVSSIVDIEYISRVDEVQSALVKINDAFRVTTPINLMSRAEFNQIITASDKWSNISNDRVSYMVALTGEHEKLSVTANNTNNAIVAFLRTNSHAPQTAVDYATGTDTITISAGTTQEFLIPDDCQYIWITKVYQTTNREPSEISYVDFKTIVEPIPLGLHEMPKSQTALNIVKRCRQLTDIKWTPAVDLYRYMLVQRGADIPATAEPQNYFGTFKAGTEYKGIPYGRVSQTMEDYGYDYATVAHYIDLETFISSVCNPDSKLCKEDVHSLAGHCSVIYATVCSGLTCYALNVAEVPTASIQNISGLVNIGKINNNGTELADSNFQIGDILNLSGYHTAIVTDIVRDSEGNIQVIELSDASTAGLADREYSDGQIGGVCRRKGWSRAKLYDSSSWGEYSLYRYTGTVPYTPNPYVNVGDEFDMQRIEHFPCMPYEGNKFKYKTGYIPNNAIKILISLDGYAYLKVFKDGTEITGSPFAVTSDTASIDITETSVGEYAAYLCNISDGDVTNLTYSCTWTIEN